MSDSTSKFPDSLNYSDSDKLASTTYSNDAKILNTLDESSSDSKFPSTLGYGDNGYAGSNYSNNENVVDGLNEFKSTLSYDDEDYLAHNRYKDIAKVINTLEIPHKETKSSYAFCA